MLSWWKTTFFWLANWGHFVNYYLLICPARNIISLNSMSNFVEDSTIPFQSHQIDFTTFSGCKPVELLTIADFILPSTFSAPHCCKQFIFHHYSSFQKWLIFLHLSRELPMEMQSINSPPTIKLWSTQTS